jgi:hypothetical protein
VPTIEVDNCIAAYANKGDEKSLLVEGRDATPDITADDGSDNDDSWLGNDEGSDADSEVSQTLTSEAAIDVDIDTWSDGKIMVGGSGETCAC